MKENKWYPESRCQFPRMGYYKRSFYNHQDDCAETDSQTQRKDLQFQGKSGKDGGKGCQGVWDQHAHTAIFKMNNQQVLPIEHRERCSMLCGRLDGRKVWKRMNTCVYTAETLCCSSKTIASLLVSYDGVCCSVVQSRLPLRSHGLQPTRLLCPWDLPDKNTGEG